MKKILYIVFFFSILINCKSQGISSMAVLNGSFITTIDTVKLRVVAGFAELGGVSTPTYSVNDTVVTVNIVGCTTGLATSTYIDQTIKINPLNQKIYKIKVRLVEYDNFVSPGCNVQKSYNSDSIHINVVTYNQIKEVQNEFLNISPHPNPIHELLILSFKNIQTHQITLFNLLGQQVYSCQTIKQNQEIDLRLLEKGIYYLKIFNLHGQQTYKILKE